MWPIRGKVTNHNHKSASTRTTSSWFIIQKTDEQQHSPAATARKKGRCICLHFHRELVSCTDFPGGPSGRGKDWQVMWWSSRLRVPKLRELLKERSISLNGATLKSELQARLKVFARDRTQWVWYVPQLTTPRLKISLTSGGNMNSTSMDANIPRRRRGRNGIRKGKKLTKYQERRKDVLDGISAAQASSVQNAYALENGIWTLSSQSELVCDPNTS